MLKLTDVKWLGDFPALYRALGLETPEARLEYLKGQLEDTLAMEYAQAPTPQQVARLEAFVLLNPWALREGPTKGKANPSNME